MNVFFNDTATTEIYALSLHDALPISTPTTSSAAPSRRSTGAARTSPPRTAPSSAACGSRSSTRRPGTPARSEEHTSELQSRQYLVCRLLLEKKKTKRPSLCLGSSYLI